VVLAAAAVLVVVVVVMNHGSSTHHVVRAGSGLSRIDPRTSVALRREPPFQYSVHTDSPNVGADPQDVDAVPDDTIWVISSSDHRLSRIGTRPPNDDKLLASVSIGSAPTQLAVSPQHVWVTDPGEKALYEVQYPG
jgi:hypothetical protein